MLLQAFSASACHTSRHAVGGPGLPTAAPLTGHHPSRRLCNIYNAPSWDSFTARSPHKARLHGQTCKCVQPDPESHPGLTCVSHTGHDIAAQLRPVLSKDPRGAPTPHHPPALPSAGHKQNTARQRASTCEDPSPIPRRSETMTAVCVADICNPRAPTGLVATCVPCA